MTTPDRLSDILKELDGITQDEIIDGRKARNELIQRAAKQGNTNACMSEELDRFALGFGYDSVYDKTLEEEDLY